MRNVHYFRYCWWWWWLSALALFYLVSSDVRAQNALCPAGWEIGPQMNKCFGLIPGSRTWEQAESLCEEHCGHLAALASSGELTFIQRLCGGIGSGCWVGGRSFNSSLGLSWKWSDSTISWNDSILFKESFNYNRSDSSYARNGFGLCTLVTHRSATLMGERCNTSHGALCMLDIENKCYHKQRHKEYFVILSVISVLILCTTLAVVIWLLAHKRTKRRRRSHKVSNPSTSSLVPPSWKVFTNEEVRSITKNFTEGNRLLGDAKTGGTYSGLLLDGSRVAVKRLKRSNFQRKKEFYSEIGRVARLRHPNLVALKGCCYDHGDRYIVYEFVANGPLDRWLHHIPRGGRSLNWPMRMRVATTLAQGIAFLHDKVKPHVVHRDIRATNVLLDEDFNSHLMGVGLSKFVPWEVMHERTILAATYGYLAPEFVYRNELTTKSDVYSFGVLLLELISGCRPTQSVESSVGWQSIFEWATPLVQAQRYLELLDPVVVVTDGAPEVAVVQKVVELVYACTQHVPSVRPRMSHVVHQLQQLEVKSGTGSHSSDFFFLVQPAATNL